MQGRKNPPIPAVLLENARNLRKDQTDAEALLWSLLRSRNFGVKFRRQYAISGYVLDFYCHELRLAIELDGSQHAAQKDYDETRSQQLLAQGIRVLRFWNNETLLETEGVLSAIWHEINAAVSSPHPGPLPEGEGEREQE